MATIARDGNGSEALGKPSAATGRRVRPFEEKLMERESGRSSRSAGIILEWAEEIKRK